MRNMPFTETQYRGIPIRIYQERGNYYVRLLWNNTFLTSTPAINDSLPHAIAAAKATIDTLFMVDEGNEPAPSLSSNITYFRKEGQASRHEEEHQLHQHTATTPRTSHFLQRMGNWAAGTFEHLTTDTMATETEDTVEEEFDTATFNREEGFLSQLFDDEEKEAEDANTEALPHASFRDNEPSDEDKYSAKTLRIDTQDEVDEDEYSAKTLRIDTQDEEEDEENFTEDDNEEPEESLVSEDEQNDDDNNYQDNNEQTVTLENTDALPDDEAYADTDEDSNTESYDNATDADEEDTEDTEDLLQELDDAVNTIIIEAHEEAEQDDDGDDDDEISENEAAGTATISSDDEDESPDDEFSESEDDGGDDGDE
jgi:hypothetical protein